MRHCENCEYLRIEGYEYPESYCYLGIGEDDPKFDEDRVGCGCRYNIRTLHKWERKDVEGSIDYPYWEKMVEVGMAEKKEGKKDSYGDKSVWYSVTRVGMDWLGLHDCVHIYDMKK